MGDKVYLGDGVYVEFTAYGLTLTTEDGVRTTNIVFLEPEVYDALTRAVNQRLLQKIERSLET
jgi:hypothetical protein